MCEENEDGKKDGMGEMPYMRKQNENEDEGRHSAEKLSLVLSKMQTGNVDRCKKLFDKGSRRNRAGRKDAELIITRIVPCAFFI